MWSKPVARLPEQVLDVGGTSGPWWPIHAVQAAAAALCCMHSFPRPPRSRLQKGCLGDGGVQRRSAPSSQGSNLWGIYFFFKLLQRRRRSNKAAEGGGAARDLLLSGLPLSSDASSSASLCSPPPPLFHSSNLPKVSALSFLFRQVGGEKVSGAKKKKNDERNLSHYFLIAFFFIFMQCHLP